MALFACSCGRRFRIMDDARRSARCPACGTVVSVDDPPAEPPPAEAAASPSTEAPARTPTRSAPARAPTRSVPARTPLGPARMPSGPARTPSTPSVPRVPAKTWNRRYAILAIAVLPLLMPLGDKTRSDEDLPARIERTLEEDHATREQREKVYKVLVGLEKGKSTAADFWEALPRHRLAGALLAKNTWAHWGFAVVSAALYFAFLLLVFPPGKTEPKHLMLTGVFTATIGILLLLLVQLIAALTAGVWFRGGGQLAILLYLLKFIGFSYNAALDPSNGFIASFLGFTAGVGFCEELCKQLPLIYHFKNKATLDWRGACLWGLASGIGFGVSEGITYCSDFYNGLAGGKIYLVRFVACVALHAMWAAAAGVVLCRRQTSIQGSQPLLAMIPPLLAIIGVPMVLHGLYDTLLKKEHDIIAVVIALVSFGWLAFQIERAAHEEKTGRPLTLSL